jgi:hypothetical protein
LTYLMRKVSRLMRMRCPRLTIGSTDSVLAAQRSDRTVLSRNPSKTSRCLSCEYWLSLHRVRHCARH